MNKLISTCDGLLDKMMECADKPFDSNNRNDKKSDELFDIIKKMKESIDKMDLISRERLKKSKNNNMPMGDDRDIKDDGRRITDGRRRPDGVDTQTQKYPNNREGSNPKREMVRKPSTNYGNNNQGNYNSKETPFKDPKEMNRSDFKVKLPEMQISRDINSNRNRDESQENHNSSKDYGKDRLRNLRVNESLEEDERRYKERKIKMSNQEKESLGIKNNKRDHYEDYIYDDGGANNHSPQDGRLTKRSKPQNPREE